MYSNSSDEDEGGYNDSVADVQVVAEENERLKVELESVKNQLEHETSLLDEEKSILAEDDNIMDKLMNSEQARRNLLQENEILAMELLKARKQLEEAARTLKVLSASTMPYGLLNSLFFPLSRNYAAVLEKKSSFFYNNWRSIAALAVAKNCSLADLIVFYQCGYVFVSYANFKIDPPEWLTSKGLTRDAQNVIWRAKIDSTICHAVVDERRGTIYYTAHFLFPGIYSVTIKKLEVGRTLNVEANPPYVKTETLLAYPQWRFRGLAIDRQQDWLYCCARVAGANEKKCFEVSYKVGVWDLRNLQQDSPPLFFIGYDQSSALLFQPYYCAVYQALGSKESLLAVSDYRNSFVHVFVVDPDVQNCKILQTIATKGSAPGSVERPCSIQFDRLGNLLVADSCNQRLQLFAPCQKVNGSLVFESKWLSETYKCEIWSVSVLQYDEYDERNVTAGCSNELTDILYVGMNDSGKVLCVNTPCF